MRKVSTRFSEQDLQRLVAAGVRSKVRPGSNESGPARRVSKQATGGTSLAAKRGVATPASRPVLKTESWHQQQLFAWAKTQEAVFPELRLMFAIPNGGLRNKATAGRLKAEGVKTGVSDIFLPVPVMGKGGLWIELKRHPGAGAATDDQIQWLTDMRHQSFAACLCKGWECARDIIVDYLQYGNKWAFL